MPTESHRKGLLYNTERLNPESWGSPMSQVCVNLTDDKAAVLIDNSYLQKEVIDNLNGRNGKFQLDYQEFSNNLCREIGAERFRTYVYDVSLESNRNFLTSLNLLDRFEIRSGKLQGNAEGFRQKQVDILLAIEMIKLALKNKIQHIILITGDSDFVPAVQYVKEEGVMVHLRHAEKTYSKELSQTCDTSRQLSRAVLIEFDGKDAYRK